MSSPTPTSSTELLRRAGLRVTAARVAVLNVLDEAPHSDAADVLARTRARLGQASVQGVYDVLQVLTDSGVVRRVQPAHSPARYEIDEGDNHHHVVCRGCGQVNDVPCATGLAPCLDPTEAERLGFDVDEAEVIYWGRCTSCRTASEPAAGLPPPRTRPD